MMKNIPIAFVVLFWLGLGMAFNMELNETARQRNCERGWWSKPLVVLAAPVLLGAVLAVNASDLDIGPADIEGCPP